MSAINRSTKEYEGTLIRESPRWWVNGIDLPHTFPTDGRGVDNECPTEIAKFQTSRECLVTTKGSCRDTSIHRTIQTLAALSGEASERWHWSKKLQR